VCAGPRWGLLPLLTQGGLLCNTIIKSLAAFLLQYGTTTIDIFLASTLNPRRLTVFPP
jgi:hypothetical protein